MLNSRKRCLSLEELIQAIKYSRKRWTNYTQDKIDAIKLCATIPNPEKIFSYDNSCAFTFAGYGEFEVDKEIEMKHLDEATYIFGVNYYGDPIVCDAKGYIRKIHFRLCMKTKCKSACICSSKKIHIGSNHELQTKSIFELSYRNRLVGARKSYSLEHVL